MATTTKAAAPAKKNSGFQGMKAAWIILVICACLGYGVWYFIMGDPDNFIGCSSPLSALVSSVSSLSAQPLVR